MTAEREAEGDVPARDVPALDVPARDGLCRCGGWYSIESGMRLLGVTNGALFVEIERR